MTREKLEGLFARRWPEPELRGPQFRRTSHWKAWFKRDAAFSAFLSIGTDEAFLAAAMMCVPEGWRLGSLSDNAPSDGKSTCHLVRIGAGWGSNPADRRWAQGPTPAEALIEAIEKAMNDA
jgi:hypothetical protein